MTLAAQGRGFATATAVQVLVSVLAMAGRSLTLADPPPGYYSPAEGKVGAELRAALHDIVHRHTVIPYSSSTRPDTSDALEVLDADPADSAQVLLIYTPGASLPADTFGLSVGWNREHLWPNSYGLDDREPAFSDLHNLRACDANVNSARGNKLYDVSNPTSPGFKLPAHAEAPLCSTDSDSWQPPESQRGDIARALFYMTIRYTGDLPGEPRLRLTDSSGQVTSTTNWMGRFSTLLQWHFADPVDAAESTRNERVWLYQSNRNPFVDQPDFVPAAFIPTLAIAAAGTNVVLQWTAEAAPTMHLDETGALPGAWIPVLQLALRTNAVWTVTVPAAGDGRLYRLRLD